MKDITIYLLAEGSSQRAAALLFLGVFLKFIPNYFEFLGILFYYYKGGEDYD